MTVGQTLKQLRTARGLTLRQLAEATGVHFSTIGNIERGTVAGRETVVRLAEALDADPDLLLAEAGHKAMPFRVLGNIAAGTPIDAVEDVETFDLSEQFDPKSHYMLRVRGDSMIEDGINDGDLAIIKHANDAQNGQTVVAVVDGEEATLKRYEKRGNRITLNPANKRLKPQTYTANEVTIRGILAGVLRTSTR